MQDLLFKVLTMFLSVASPQIVQTIRVAVNDLVIKAAATDNPWDDMFAGLLQGIVGKPDPDPNKN